MKSRDVRYLKASLMRRPYNADNPGVRTFAAVLIALSCAAPAAAAGPRFGLFDLHDLGKASKNEYGDVKVTHGRPAAAFVVRCATGCRFGAGWIGFEHSAGPRPGDVVSASAGPGRIGWSLKLRLTARGQSRWRSYARVADRRARE